MQFDGTDYGRAEWGTTYRDEKKQSRFKAGGGEVRVRTIEDGDEFLEFTLPRLTATQFAALRAFLATTVDGAATTFTLTDDWGTARTVRWWDSALRWEERAGRFYRVTMMVRVEA